MFLKLLLLSTFLLGIALLALGVQLFFSKKKAFPETHIGENRHMRERKIYCSKTEQKIIDSSLKGKTIQVGCSCTTGESCDV